MNTKLTMNALDWVAKQSVQRILFASSSENYAATTDLFDAAFLLPNRSVMHRSVKHPALDLCHYQNAWNWPFHSAKALDYDSTIVRYQNIIGPEMGFGHAIPHIVERFASGTSFSVQDLRS